MRKIIFPLFLTICFAVLLVFSLIRFKQNNGKNQIKNNILQIKVEQKSEYVDPFIGTDFHGHTFPGATVPFGMVQLSPDTRLDGWDGCSAYHYSDSLIWGFSHTHLSGTGCSDYADILLLPINNINQNNPLEKYYSFFDKSSEIAEAGYYEVMLKNFNIKTQLTATERVGFHKYTYPSNENKLIFIDLEQRDQVLKTYLKQINDTLFIGLRESKAWAKDQILYFAIAFSEPMKNPLDNNNLGNKFLKNKQKFIFQSQKNDGNILKVKVALSAVNENAAIKNLQAEIPDWNFEKVRENARKAWDKELSKILVSGATEDQKKTFYTALYHSFIVPNIYSDIDGYYRSTDLKIHQDTNHDTYTVFSLWDTYRAAHPLYTITQQKRTADFINTFLNEYKYGGQLPVWELSANETMCMIGYHAVPPIVDAYFKGIKFFDTELALKAMISAANEKRLGKQEFAKYGYIPMDLEHESVSKNLEYCYDDWCIAQFAKATGNLDIYKEYLQRSQYYKNIFNDENGFMQAKINAAFYFPFDPKEVNFNYTEANSWQYSFYVPQDILTFIEMHGGNENFAAHLDSLFLQSTDFSGIGQVDITGLIGQYAHGNEPSQHIAYLYNYCKQPWKTQKIVRKIMNELYTSKPDGLCGNEDCGQMSAWYVLSAMGFYSTNPANGIYDFGTPIFDTVMIQLENGKIFTIIAENISSENIYIQNIKLNDKNYNKLYITHQDIMNGGKLLFVMGNEPNKNLGNSEIYYSKIAENLITPIPYTDKQVKSFYDSLIIELNCIDKKAEIYYSLDNNIYQKPIKYQKPIVITKDCELKFYAKRDGHTDSKIVSAKYRRIPNKKEITLISKYSPQYAAGGNNALIDIVTGTENFKCGAWQGYKGQNFEAIIDLLQEKNIKSLNARFIQDNNSWIFFPRKVEFYSSNDGKNFTKIATLPNKMSFEDTKVKIQNFKTKTPNLKTKYIKVFGQYFGQLPDWHLSPGYDSWLFIDEIEIEEE